MTPIAMNHDSRLRLAMSFCGVLREWLGESCMADVVARNAMHETEGVCATHDYCDANIAMAQAFEATFGRPPLTPADVEEEGGSESALEAETDLWNAAWELAKRGEFSDLKIHAFAVSGSRAGAEAHPD